MSIMNVWIEPDRATVAVDTEGFDPRFGKIWVSKMVPHVQLNAVLAARGSGGLIAVMCSGLLRDPRGFDALTADMPGLAAASLVEYERQAAKMGVSLDSLSPADQIAWVGWSDEEQQMVGWLYLRGVGERTFTQRRIKPWVVMPGEPFTGLPDTPKSHADHLRIGRQQTRWHRSALPGRAIGGDMIVAEFDRAAMTTTNIGDLDAGLRLSAGSRNL